MTLAVFWFFAAWTIVSALFCITRRNPVASALWLVSAMFALAAIFVLLNAQFIAAVQVIVYAGAVMVLFLFVIMLLNLEARPKHWRRWWLAIPAGALALVMLVQLLPLGQYSVSRMANEFSSMPAPDPAHVFPEGDLAVQAVATRGVVGAVAEPLFQGYLVPFEITSVLLLVAVIGSVVLAKKRL
ncbi:MAG TPA: NADH-quinone oxidoreductase subunit J [Gemmatimonadales bacterium]|nr:NADH-quinone oxidoreductase subunit J [Gemmatimonadales bacterium]